MQVRIGNKQDEAAARALITTVLQEDGKTLDLNGADSDLRQIEINYFGHDGAFFVAEVDRKVVGMAAAIKKTETVCELKRLYVGRDNRGQGIGGKLLQQCIGFARNLDYQVLTISCSPSARCRASLIAKGFEETAGELSLTLQK